MPVRLKQSLPHLKEEEKERQKEKENQVDQCNAGNATATTGAVSARSSQRSCANREKENLEEAKATKVGDSPRGDNLILERGPGVVTVLVEAKMDHHINHNNHQHHLGTILARPI